MLLSVVPELAAVLVLAKWVHEAPRTSAVRPVSVRLAWRGLSPRFKAYVGVLVLFTLGNSSDAFLVLRAQTLGFGPIDIFLVLAAFSLVTSLSSTPAGALSDVLGRKPVIVLGWVVYAAIFPGCGASAPWVHSTFPSRSKPTAMFGAPLRLA